VKAGGRHRRDEPDQQIGWLEDKRAGAVFPDALEAELEPSIGALRETVVGDGRSDRGHREPRHHRRSDMAASARTAKSSGPS
jgi:hypothetical protein